MDVAMSCAVMKVGRSGYYKWLKRSDRPDKDRDDHLLIKEIFDQGKAKYGVRTIKMKLGERDVVMNRKKIARIMKEHGLITKIRRKNPYKAMMKKTLEHRIFENKLNREFRQKTPFKVFLTDITYLPFNNRFGYLSVVKDIASGEVVAWNITRHLGMSLVIDTVKKMRDNGIVPSLENVMIHSDRGFHYTNPLYVKVVGELGMAQSMSRKGNCIDNAPMESFFGHLKDEVDYKDCKTFEQLHSLIEEYMRYYNNERQQWDLKKMTPVEYRNHLLIAAG